MKRTFWIIILILSVAQFAWADGVVMATDSDLAAFDSLVRQDQKVNAGSLKKESIPTSSFGPSIKDEAAKLKNEGSQGRGSQLGKWVIEQRKANRAADDAGAESKANQHIRENGKSKK
jgi:hypothetical protein